jgi:glycosyltransferase involved in cell wall biosynthesis
MDDACGGAQMKKKVLVGSPVHQKPHILKEFLQSLHELSHHSLRMDYLFIDDNEWEESRSLLQEFADAVADRNVTIWKSTQVQPYDCNDRSHIWDEPRIQKVAGFKDRMIAYALEQQYDFLFLVDSDLLLHPKTVEHLVASGKDIVATIFWTQWEPGAPHLPQVWLSDQYTLFYKRREEVLAQEEISRRIQQFLRQLQEPGLYEVGGLGACTLISKKALESGVCFREIKNISFMGEDRHFCIRAAALGFSLFVDTCYPAYHIYRESDLEGVREYRKQNETRELANLQHEIRKAVQDGFAKLGTFHYQSGYPHIWQPYFSDAMNTVLMEKIQNEYSVNCEKKLSVTAKVEDCQVTSWNLSDGVALVRFTLVNQGMENGSSFYEKFECEANLKRENSKWVIDGFTILRSIPDSKPPLLRIAKDRGNKLTLSMIVKNEASRYLETVLQEHRHYIDEAVIIDDGSTDHTVELCRNLLQGIPVRIIQNPVSRFSNEIELRKQQWEETLKTDPDWILNLDADEMFEKKFRDEVRRLINQQEFDVILFRLYDFWDAHHYREDQYWKAHLFYRPFLIRYQRHFHYVWRETPQHCGRFPANILDLPSAASSIRLKHFGWATPQDRIGKYNRYLQLDPGAKFGWKEQYESILDETPRLVRWQEEV